MPFLAGPAGSAIASIIGGTAAAGAQIYGAKKTSNTARNASRLESEAAAKALAIEQENTRRAEEAHNREQDAKERQWQAEQRRLDDDRAYARMQDALELEAVTAQEQRRAPYRVASSHALRSMAQSIGIDFPDVPAAAFDPASRARAILAGQGQSGTGYAQTASRPAVSSMADAVKGATTPGLTETDPRLLARTGSGTMADVIDYRRKPRYVR